MSRLRREEEARAYERMISPPPPSETFAQRFPASPSPFSTSKLDDFDDDEVSYQEVHRQIILIINVLVSIIACSVFIWVAARHWSAPKRLGLSMGGSGMVAIAEVVIYSGYVRKVKEAKVKERKKPEIKQIIESWIIDGSAEKDADQTGKIKETVDDGIRYRKGKHR
jgi:TMEM199 family protein